MSTSEKLDIPIGLDLTEVRAALGSLKSELQTAELFGAGLGSQMVTAASHATAMVDPLKAAREQSERSIAIWNRKSNVIDASVVSSHMLQQALQSQVAPLQKSLILTNQIDASMRRVAATATQASSSISRIKPNQLATTKPPMSLFSIAAITASVIGIGKVGGVLKTVGSVARSVSRGMDQFRLAANAPIVNPKLNTLASIITGVGAAVTGTLSKMRGSIDAIISDPLAALESLQAMLSKFVALGNDTVAMFARWLTSSSQISPMMQALGLSTEQWTSAVRTLQGVVESATQRASMSISRLSGSIASLGGEFKNAEGSAQTFNFAQQTISRPLQLASRWMATSEASARKLAAAKRFMLTPITAVKEAVQGEVQSWKLMRSEVDKLPAKQRIAAIAMHELHYATRPVRMIFRGVAAAGRGLFRGLAPAARVTTSAVSGLTTRVSQAARSMRQTISPANVLKSSLTGIRSAAVSAGGGLKSMTGGLLGSKLAMAALLAGSIAWGGATAIATETATTKFGTLLSDMGQGKALIKEITAFSAATPFSNEALRESAGLLLGAQTPADQITAKLTTLGDIAAGTSKPIEEFATVFSKVANTGKLGLGEINQFAERGVPLYDALQSTLGVSRAEMLKMVSDGKLGFSHLEAALGSLTTGTGVFAGGMAAQSQTIAGLWSTLKDNIGIALEGIVGVFLEAGKPIMSGIITLVQGIAATIERLKPVFAIVADAWIAGFTAVYALGVNAFSLIGEAATGALSLIGINGGLTFDGLLVNLVTFFTLAKYSFENFPLLAAIAFYSTGLSFVSMANDIGYFFTATLPAYMSWFGDNWALLFLDAAALVGTFAENIKNNIVNAWTAIWDYITGKSDALNFDWTPLTDGFRKTIADLPDIPERALSQLEVQMSADISNMKSQFADGAADAVALALEKLKPVEAEKLKATTAPNTGIVEDSGGTDGKAKPRTNFSVDSLDRGSTEALKAIYANQSRDKTPEQQLGQAKQQTKLLEKIANKPAPVLPVAGPA